MDDLEVLNLLDNHAPFVVLFSVHDVHQPALDQGRVLAAITANHGDLQILTFVADEGDGRHEVLEIVRRNLLPGVRNAYCRAGSERLEQAAFLNSLRNIIHSELSLNNLERF